MLWSLFKIVLFVVLIGAATIGAAYLLETDGGMRIDVGGMEFNLGALQAVIALIVLVLVLWLILKLAGLIVATIRFLNGDETAISRHFDRNRERKGYQALAEGMMALASGEDRTAITKAARAERYLRRPELTNLITAQAAEMAGDRKKATQVYKRLLADERTRFVGVRGLMKQKLEEGDTETAMKLAEKAFALKPQHAETGDVLLALQATQNDWTGARDTLGKKVKHGALPKDVGKRRDAVLALQEAKGVFEEGNSIRAREAAIEANRLSPDLVPAAILAARSYMEQENPRYAARVLSKAYKVTPHPDIAAAFAEIKPDESADERLKRFKTLTKEHPDSPETRMLLAELQISAGNYQKARDALGDLPTTKPTQRVLTLMAAIERGLEAPDSEIRGWLAKAVVAPRGPQWVCDKCHHIHGDWTPICANCGAFDTLSWTEPTEGDVRMPGGARMDTLLVGAPDIAPDPEMVVDAPEADAEPLQETQEAAEDVVDVTPAEDAEPETKN
ncbi:heme biosynthesis HemY N-terminal domain-containing protein [Maritimibacter sp. UBA3975]|uniref:heme biosynthesis protein HemY n=1 Tax=Maritimibacter sp. UBA3975 TaxID=1946833 RepID=UPI000C0B3992|nr:heme biosynthesis HemY N-terminal domain-containing protein [Maritimibacter sp. UBA3975]MAM63508.1 heme biosynthesis protein HemY [Maritimibacter sp.]|tara:strand:- start:102143 stop:103657 length:1515 start_codon:yes stop_codon:yes gene_type:complete